MTAARSPAQCDAPFHAADNNRLEALLYQLEVERPRVMRLCWVCAARWEENGATLTRLDR